MPKLPVVSGPQMVKALERAGWVIKRRESSHIVLTKPGHWASLSIPDHRELDRGLLRGLIRDAGLTISEFEGLLGEIQLAELRALMQGQADNEPAR